MNSNTELKPIIPSTPFAVASSQELTVRLAPKRRNLFQRHNRWWIKTIYIDGSAYCPRYVMLTPFIGQCCMLGYCLIHICFFISRKIPKFSIRHFLFGPDVED